MDLSKIYQNRFAQAEKRKAVWEVIVRDFLQRFVPKSSVVLDMPCGYGEFINNIECKKKFGLDLNKDCKIYLDKKVEFINRLAWSTELKSASIDIVFISNFFEHITKEEIIKVIKEVKRILKKGGKVMIFQPNIRFCAKDYWMFFDHITPVDDRALKEAFEVEGYSTELIIPRFLPYTMSNGAPAHPLLVSLYLKIPLAWKIIGKQSLLVFRK